MRSLSISPLKTSWLASHRPLMPQPCKSSMSVSIPFGSCNFPSFVLKSSSSATKLNAAADPPPLVVVGSANADIFLEIDRLPDQGETIAAHDGFALPGGKGANQAACAAKLSYPTYFVGQVGDDSHGIFIIDELKKSGVSVDFVREVSGVPTGHAVVMLQPGGENSIIISGGANMRGWPNRFSPEELEIVNSAGIVMLQREIPDSVNLQIAEAASAAGVPVILDAGGMDAPFPSELLSAIDVLSPNETELSRITGMPTETMEQIQSAVNACHELGVKNVLLKLGERGSALFAEGEKPLFQPIFSAAKVVDTTGAGDTFTAAFAVALLEGKPRSKCLQFAAAAASVCIEEKGAMPSMPDRRAVLNRVLSA